MRRVQAIAIDVLAVLVFAVIGRRSHAEANDLLGVLGTAWPFLAGALLAHGLLAARHVTNAAKVSAGVPVWIATVVLGMVLRLISGSTAQWPFVVVATISLAILLLGWRLCWVAIGRARRSRSHRAHPAS